MVHPNVVCHDAYVLIDPVTIKPPRPTFSNAGRWLIVVSVPWFFLVLLGSSALGLVGRDDPQAQRILAIIVAGAPVIVLVFHQWLGRVPGLRWLHHRTSHASRLEPTALTSGFPMSGSTSTAGTR